MAQLSGDYSTIFKIDYLDVSAPGRTDENMDYLRSKLEGLGRARIRGHRSRPATGGGIGFEVIVEFIGVAAASGLIGHLTGKFWDQFVEIIKGYYDRRNSRRFTGIRISYDDLDIVIELAMEGGISTLPELLSQIRQVLDARPPSDAPVKVTVPVVFDRGKWYPYGAPYSDAAPEYPFRYWLVVTYSDFVAPQIYDTHEGRLIDITYQDYDTYLDIRWLC